MNEEKDIKKRISVIEDSMRILRTEVSEYEGWHLLDVSGITAFERLWDKVIKGEHALEDIKAEWEIVSSLPRSYFLGE